MSPNDVASSASTSTATTSLLGWAWIRIRPTTRRSPVCARFLPPPCHTDATLRGVYNKIRRLEEARDGVTFGSEPGIGRSRRQNW